MPSCRTAASPSTPQASPRSRTSALAWTYPALPWPVLVEAKRLCTAGDASLLNRLDEAVPMSVFGIIGLEEFFYD
ncbi:hypothetical protein E2562_029112 [Oryza meyeriana var. granulata]|uniref:Uncharacterized protein n=1 Tax=Oryza meyeriana var. granulata TaxID=110450 RepID=A0A6G1EBV3_9ORYZ|nr:hypothetical protein E2562_029112 [Oryza meyeriana var. granulata]